MKKKETDSIDRQIAIQPVVNCPKNATAGKTYLMTVDLRVDLQGRQWPYPEEEYPIHCFVDTGKLFACEPIGEPVIILHRFGGTYGPASFMLESARKNTEGKVTIKLVNRHGMVLRTFQIENVRISGKKKNPKEISKAKPSGVGLPVKQPIPFPPPSRTPKSKLSKTELPVFRFLHLSDLHFKDGDDTKKHYRALRTDLKRELGCETLDVAIVSGDVGNHAQASSYVLARDFLEMLRYDFALERDRIVLVPGNHDVDREISDDWGYDLKRWKDAAKEYREGIDFKDGERSVYILNEEGYKERFHRFAKFYEDVRGERYPYHYEDQGTVFSLEPLNIVVLGLNSAWELDHIFKDRISIFEDAVEKGLDRILGEIETRTSLKFAVWHHPFAPSPNRNDHIKNMFFLHQLAQAGFCVCLHGHMHKPEGGNFVFEDSGRKMDIVGVGSFANLDHPGYPLHYNLLEIVGDELTVICRRRGESSQPWGPFFVWKQGNGKDPSSRRTIRLPFPVAKSLELLQKKREIKKKASEDPVFHDDVRRYCKRISNLHRDIPTMGFPRSLRSPIPIEEIYVTLRAMVDLRAGGESCFADSEDAEACIGGEGTCREIDLPQALEEAIKRGRQGVVILGDPGSGKSTHLKRLLLWSLADKPDSVNLPNEILPVFLPLREWTDPSKSLITFMESQLNHPHLQMPNGFGKKMLERGRLLFLLDGLDEVADTDLRVEVTRWIEKAMDVYPDSFFVVTCRFAGYNEEVRFKSRFLELHIRPLSPEKANEFVRKWYRIVERGLIPDPEQAEAVAKTKADDLLEGLAQPEYRARKVLTMTRNPLLLTNLCLVHRDRGMLPKHRVILYKECTEVLLELWRRAKKITSRVNASDGKRILQPAALYMHSKNLKRAKGKELAKAIEPALKHVKWPYGDAADFLAAVREDSGLLTGWGSGEYGFMHLGFQEYLAAMEIWRLHFRGRSTKALKILAKGFGSAWWQEVILMLLAIPEISAFEPFFEQVVELDSFAQNNEMVDMCLEDAAEVSSKPFLQLLKKDPGQDESLWRRQKAALKALNRIAPDLLQAEYRRPLLKELERHPFHEIRLWAENVDHTAKSETVVSGPIGYELVRIPRGTFIMGSNPSERGRRAFEGPAREVSVETFYMGRYPLTNLEYERFLDANPDVMEPKYWSDRKFNSPEQPVVGVTWDEAERFAKWAGLQLPSEAQWEYACRAGTSTRYCTGDSERDLDRAGWYGQNSGGHPHPAGEKEPNAFGLFDMHGNVYEWCEDDWHENYDGAPSDGRSWTDSTRGLRRVFRGGSWDSRPDSCRSASRNLNISIGRNNYLGFRLVLVPGSK